MNGRLSPSPLFHDRMKLPKTTFPPGEEPKTPLAKILASTPVIMTVVATLLAGLSNGEMTRAQYDRGLAAQLQSKVGDQWSFFQAKKLRGATLKASLELLHATSDAAPLQPATLTRFVELSEPALTALTKGEIPLQPDPVKPSDPIQQALMAAAEGRPESEVTDAVRALKPADVEGAIAGWQTTSKAQDTALGPINSAVEKAERSLQAAAAANRDGARSLLRDLTAAKFRLDAARYDNEARYNRAIAELSELKVRITNLSAERHHRRSQQFFFGMLGAQLAVILSTFAMAVQRRNLLWSAAAGIGLLALGFGVYVYVWM